MPHEDLSLKTLMMSTTSSSSSAGGFRGVRVSKFRHVFGTAARRENCYEGMRITASAHDSQCCAVNPKFIAVILEVAGGGAFQAIPLKWTGKVDYNVGRVSGHNGPVTDIRWNPFNDNVIASASDDTTVKLWHIPDEGIKGSLTEWLCELAGHSRKVAYVEWHPTAENVLASAGFDHRILIWNVTSGICLVEIDCHEDTIYSMSFNKSGSLLSTTCKDKILRIINARTGEVVKQGWCHDGSKASKVVYIGDKMKLFTTGFSRSSTRQLALWDENDLSRPLVLQEVDSSSGVLFPFYDPDTNMVYIAGKGDGNVRYYEIADSKPFVFYLSEFRSSAPQRGLGVLPKRGLKITQCEIYRFYKVHNTQPLVEPISFVVPRKSEMFQADLYPPTASPTPALSPDEWICGIDRDPVLVSLKAGFVSATNKPVQLKKAIGDEGMERAHLITADRNNERKFRFLSEVTRPDYREVTQRDDYERIMKEEKIRNKMNEILSHRLSSSGDEAKSPLSSPIPQQRKSRKHISESAPLARLSLSSGDEMTVDDDENRPPPSSCSAPPAMSSSPIKNLSARHQKPPKSPATTSESSSLSAVGDLHSRSRNSYLAGDEFTEGIIVEGMEEDFDSNDIIGNKATVSQLVDDRTREGLRSTPISPNLGKRNHSVLQQQNRNQIPFQRQTSLNVSSVDSTIAENLPASSSVANMHSRNGHHVGVTPIIPNQFSQLPRLTRPTATRVSSASDTSNDMETENREKPPATRPGRIIPGPLIPREQTAHIKPFLISHSQPPTPQGKNFGSSQTSLDSPSKKELELHKLYTQQCKQVRSLMDDLENRDRRISQLDKDVQTLANQVARYERSLIEKRDESESLRYEIQWKDARIIELQNQLYKALHQQQSKSGVSASQMKQRRVSSDGDESMS